jgi:beta-phosphoglucomutase-like phosphatase (HAD superfamily)
VTTAVAIDLDGALGDTRPLWQEFLADAARRFGSIAALEP